MMNLSEFKPILNQHPAAHLHFVLPDATFVPSHARITEVIRQFPLQAIEASPGEIVPRLTGWYTACLAEDQCKPKPPEQFNPLTFILPRAKPSACCGGNHKTCHE